MSDMSKKDITNACDWIVDALKEDKRGISAEMVVDIASAAVGALEQVDWVKGVLAEYGYHGPLAEGCCPLREMLVNAAPEAAQPAPVGFTEYVIEFGDGRRSSCFDRKVANEVMEIAADTCQKFTFSAQWYDFADEWKFAQSMLKQGQPLGATSLLALKLGLAAGMRIEL